MINCEVFYFSGDVQSSLSSEKMLEAASKVDVTKFAAGDDKSVADNLAGKSTIGYSTVNSASSLYSTSAAVLALVTLLAS